MKRKYTKVTLEQVMELYYQDFNLSQIAFKLNCARNTIRKKIRLCALEYKCNIYIGRGRPRLKECNASRCV